MRTMIWKRGAKIDESIIKEAEDTFDIKYPEDYKNVIREYNNARPTISTFDTEVSKEHVFKKLLSLKKNDIETVYKAKQVLSSIDNSLIPFGIDPAGNFLCFKKGFVYYWLHEDNTIRKVANNFSDFIDSLY